MTPKENLGGEEFIIPNSGERPDPKRNSVVVAGAEAPNAGRKTVPLLVVDDYNPVTESISRILARDEKLNPILTASDGITALFALQNIDPEKSLAEILQRGVIVITDTEMHNPEGTALDGPGLIALLRAIEAGKLDAILESIQNRQDLLTDLHSAANHIRGNLDTLLPPDVVAGLHTQIFQMSGDTNLPQRESFQREVYLRQGFMEKPPGVQHLQNAVRQSLDRLGISL